MTMTTNKEYSVRDGWLLNDKPVSWEVAPSIPSGGLIGLTTSTITDPLSVLVLRTSPCFSLCGDKTKENREELKKHHLNNSVRPSLESIVSSENVR